MAPVPETERVMMETSGGGGRREEHREHFSIFQTGSEGASGGKEDRRSGCGEGGPEDGGMGAGQKGGWRTEARQVVQESAAAGWKDGNSSDGVSEAQVNQIR